ncbi:protein transport protein bos1 [Malassezia sp. CBS 17886]|nr:protein transport protein bos1 [Malassezia sp. CBS 17886]
MNSLYNLATRQSAAIRSDIASYGADVSAGTGASRSPQISAAISALLKTVEDYEGMAKRELVVAKREKALARADDLRADVRLLREDLACARSGASTAGAGAAEPGAPRPAGVQTGASSSGWGPGAQGARARAIDMSGAGATTLVMDASAAAPYGTQAAMPRSTFRSPAAAYSQSATSDPLAAYRMPEAHAPNPDAPYSMRESHALREHSFVQNTEAQLDTFIAQGRSVLGNLVEQRGILKGTRRRLLDAANTVGLSRNLIVRAAATSGSHQGYIDRLSTQDTVIFAVGAVLTLVAFFYIYRWFG